jgi:dihydropyrimidinase
MRPDLRTSTLPRRNRRTIAAAMVTRRDALRSIALGLAAGVRVEAWSAASRQATPSEIVIRGGRVANADGVSTADVRIAGGKIVEVAPGVRPGPGARVLDANGRIVMPGGIDPHTHLHPGFVDDLTSGSRAALAGGITTVGTFAGAQAGETALDALERMSARVAREAIADVFLHLNMWPPTPELADALPAIARHGQPSIKVYMMRSDFGARVADLIVTLEAAREAGVVTLVHCEDAAILGAAVRRLEREGRTSLRHYAASRPVVAEVAATQQAMALCESTGAPLYVVHLSSARALEACRSARAQRLPVYVETRPLYLHLTEERLEGADAPLYVGQPPLRARADADALWDGLTRGGIDVLATDHAPWTREQKLDPSLSIAKLRPGVSDLRFMLPMYFSEGVGTRGLPLERFVETTSTNAARIFGLYPRKGVIRAGADADVVIWDPRRSDVVTAAADPSNADYTPYEGWRVTGWPVTTIRRGQVVFEAGQVSGEPGSGTLVSRERWTGQADAARRA